MSALCVMATAVVGSQPWADVVASPVGPALLYAAAGSVVILGMAALAALLMRRSSASARHEVWLVGIVGALLLPVLSAALPAWHVLPRVDFAPLSPRGLETRTTPQITSSPTPAAVPANSIVQPMVPDSAIANAPAPTAPDVQTQTGPAASAESTLPAPVQPVVIVSSMTSRSAQALNGGNARPASSWSWSPWLLLAWAAGALLLLARLLLGHVSLWSLRIRSGGRITLIDRGPLFDLLEELREDLGLRRRVELLCSRDRTVPMTWGLLRSRLLVPEQAVEWSHSQQRDVLLHELGHLKRWDCQTLLLSQVACALYWFNPLAWVAARRMLVERERACDDLVLSYGAEAPAYARHLLQSVSPVTTPRLAAAAVAMARPSTLEERMRAILDDRLNRRAMTKRGSVATILLLLVALVPAAVLRAQTASNAGQPPKTSTPTPPGSASASGGGGAEASYNDPQSQANPGGGGGGGDAGRDASATRPPRRALGGGGISSTGVPPGGRRQPANAGGFGPNGEGGGGGGFGSAGGYGGGGGSPFGLFGGRGQGGQTDGPTCTFDVTIYDVRVPVEQIGKIDVDALADASQLPDDFEVALAALGTTRPMYRVNQSVRLSGDSVMIGSEVPVVTGGSRTTDRGQVMSPMQVQYQSVGAHFTIAGRAGDPQDPIDLDLGIEVSSSSDTGTALGDNVNAPILRRATMSHKGPVEPKRAFVIVSVDANSVDKEGKAVAYIGRVTLGQPHQPAGRPGPGGQ